MAWGVADGSRSRGVIAAGMENGELILWDPAAILDGTPCVPLLDMFPNHLPRAISSQAESLILRNTTHTGPVRGLDFNPIQTNLLSSGAVNGEVSNEYTRIIRLLTVEQVYIWDLKDPSKPYSPTPGTRSTKLDEITSVAWNQQVPSVLAGASTTGYTVVWDLRGKREVVALAYGGGAGTMSGRNVSTTSGMAAGGRRGMSAIAWHPDNVCVIIRIFCIF